MLDAGFVPLAQRPGLRVAPLSSRSMVFGVFGGWMGERGGKRSFSRAAAPSCNTLHAGPSPATDLPLSGWNESSCHGHHHGGEYRAGTRDSPALRSGCGGTGGRRRMANRPRISHIGPATAAAAAAAAARGARRPSSAGEVLFAASEEGVREDAGIEQARACAAEEPSVGAEQRGQCREGVVGVAQDVAFDERRRARAGFDELGGGGVAQGVCEGELDEGVGGAGRDVEGVQEGRVGGVEVELVELCRARGVCFVARVVGFLDIRGGRRGPTPFSELAAGDGDGLRVGGDEERQRAGGRGVVVGRGRRKWNPGDFQSTNLPLQTTWIEARSPCPAVLIGREDMQDMSLAYPGCAKRKIVGAICDERIFVEDTLHRTCKTCVATVSGAELARGHVVDTSIISYLREALVLGFYHPPFYARGYKTSFTTWFGVSAFMNLSQPAQKKTNLTYILRNFITIFKACLQFLCDMISSPVVGSAISPAEGRLWSCRKGPSPPYFAQCEGRRNCRNAMRTRNLLEVLEASLCLSVKRLRANRSWGLLMNHEGSLRKAARRVDTYGGLESSWRMFFTRFRAVPLGMKQEAISASFSVRLCARNLTLSYVRLAAMHLSSGTYAHFSKSAVKDTSSVPNERLISGRRLPLLELNLINSAPQHPAEYMEGLGLSPVATLAGASDMPGCGPHQS
nr:hypothetical protein CFP56_32354 [Quercus suber]